MLNISNNKLHDKVDISQYEAAKKILGKKHYTYFNRFLQVFTVILIIILFLPWTQTIQGIGYVTTLTPEQRPQTIQSPIPGRVEKWYVREGDSVAKGDTILFISEVKNEYFDPLLVERTEQQVRAKSNSVLSYSEKVLALSNQIQALQAERALKLEQAENKRIQALLKIKSDSIDYEAAKTNLAIAERQYERTLGLQQEGLKAVTDVEEKRLKLQETQAKLISQENKLLASRNELINAQIEINRVGAEYTDKISKAQSDRSTAQSNRFDSEAAVSKLENDRTNYEIRNDMYYITAPQSGFINKAIIGGVGETFKEGQQLVGIMPSKYDLAVETFVRPIDLPLIHVGEEVRIQFDGWPSIVFSGWPYNSLGTFGGKVVAVERFISNNGKYRVLLAPDPDEEPWPEALRVGSGATTLALLEDVPIWYEMWRKLNGFPPNYYTPEKADIQTEKKK
ncbi:MULTISPECIES: HlyD family secretion protein [unclassified Leeuwenhoekiella]|uniref:HlyD family secretion protein n=1 Tax=unclassified Leeuwenhoekiella TaxID=2615029 RepID=UPI000C4B30BB|nr:MULTISPECIES: biotin/lipoyl-binding protein [unclassified Leeuwenhoekiella]MAW93991.1 biotin attachment protein [Leeuwenhoekiella sp.]MBA80970.1 biotin attachment protein [Leeuwenhoekiella sp.]|tara:strand:+ start:8344 stop:9699 length:1356 start_codon:yes stop_codon:yes gene_type:complete